MSRLGVTMVTMPRVDWGSSERFDNRRGSLFFFSFPFSTRRFSFSFVFCSFL